MRYISKGMVLKPSTEHILNVSRCGDDFKLTGINAKLWLDGRYTVAMTKDVLQETKLKHLVRIGLAEVTEETGLLAAYRLLTGCVICPAKLKSLHRPLNSAEHRLWKWISQAGLRLTASELVMLNEKDIHPADSLLGEANRQALTESIYTAETIFDGILEGKMEHSPARDRTMKALLGLLRKKRILLI